MKKKTNIYQYAADPTAGQFQVLGTLPPAPQQSNFENVQDLFITTAKTNQANALAKQKKLEEEARKRKSQTLAQQSIEKAKETQARIANTKTTASSTKVNQNIEQKNLGKNLKDIDLAKENLEYQRALETAFIMNLPYIQGAYNKDVNEFYNEAVNNLDFSKLEEVMSDPEFSKKIEDFKYQDFLKKEQEAYDKAGIVEKGLNLTSAFFADPILTTQNLLLGSEETGYHRPLIGQWQGLNADNSVYKDFYKRATGADENWLNTGLNYINPAYYAGEAVLSSKEGDIMGTALDLTNAFLLGRLNLGKGAAKIVTNDYVQSGLKGVQNVLKGRASAKDLFKRSDLVQIKNPKKLAQMEAKIASGKLEPADYRFYSSLQKSPNALSYAEGQTPYFVKNPMTAAEASSYNLKSLAKDLAKGKLSTNDAAAVEQALSRSIPSLEEVMSDKALKKIYDNLPKGLKKADVDFALNNPTDYWKISELANNKLLTDFLGRKDFFSKAEYLLPSSSPTRILPKFQKSSLEALEAAAAAPLIERQALLTELTPIGEKLSHLGRKTITEEKKQGGNLNKSFNNSGFKSLPLYVQNKIKMGSNNKYQIGSYLIPGEKTFRNEDGMICDENGCTPEDQYFTDLAQAEYNDLLANNLQTSQRAARALVEAADADSGAKKYWNRQGVKNLSQYLGGDPYGCIVTAGSKGYQVACPEEQSDMASSIFWSNQRLRNAADYAQRKKEGKSLTEKQAKKAKAFEESGRERIYKGKREAGRQEMFNIAKQPGDMLSKLSGSGEGEGHAVMYLGDRSNIEKHLKEGTIGDSVYNYLSPKKWKEILNNEVNKDEEDIIINSPGDEDWVTYRQQGLEYFEGSPDATYSAYRYQGTPTERAYTESQVEDYLKRGRDYRFGIPQQLQTLGIPQVQTSNEIINTFTPTPIEYKSKRQEKKAKKFQESYLDLLGNIKKSGGMLYGEGAEMPQGQMTDYPITEFNEGGTHEENPFGGIYQGMHPNGKPNVTEEKEVKITRPDGTQFIVSAQKDMKITEEIIEQFPTLKPYKNKTVLDTFKIINRDKSFNGQEREGDTIQENSKNIIIEDFIAAHEILSEMKNQEEAIKKEEAFNKDLDKMMEEHPEYMEALLAQSAQPMQQEAPYPGDEAIMQQVAMQGGMPPMMATYGGNISQATGGYMNYAKGGYTVRRSNDRKDKTHEVVRNSDGKTEYYGHKMKNKPKNKKAKKAAEARHRAQGNFNNPFFKAYWDATWEYGGPMEYRKGSNMIKRADGSYSQRGLWDNIRDKAKENKAAGKKGTKPKPGSPMAEQIKKINANNKAYGGSFNNAGFNALPTEVQNKIKTNSMGYGSNMYGYGSNMYNFGADLAQGIGKGLQMAAPVLSKVPGLGPIASTVAGAGGAALENVGTGADLKEVLTDTAFGAAGGMASTIPGLGTAVDGLENIYDANNVSASEEALMQESIAKYGGMQMKCGGMKYGKGGKMGCNCYKCGGKMHANGGNIFQNSLAPADATNVNPNLRNVNFAVEPMLPGASNNAEKSTLPNIQKIQESEEKMLQTTSPALTTGVNMNLNPTNPLTTFEENDNLTQQYINARLGKNLRRGGNIHQFGDFLNEYMMSGYDLDVPSSMEQIGGKGTQQPSEFTYQRGFGSVAADMAPIAYNLYAGLKKPETYTAKKIDLKAPQLSFSETEKALDRNLAGIRKSIKAGGKGGSYLSNLIAAQGAGNRAVSSAYQDMMGAQAKLDFDASKTNELYNLDQSNKEDAQNINAQMLQGQAMGEAFKGVAGLSDKYATENLAAAYASMANPQFKLNIANPSFKKGQFRLFSGMTDNS